MACVTEYSENQWYIKNVILIANNSLKEFLYFLSSSGKKKFKLEVFLESKVRTLKYMMQVTFFLSPISIKCLVNTLLKSLMSSMELFCDAYLMNNCCECILQYYISAMLYVLKKMNTVYKMSSMHNLSLIPRISPNYRIPRKYYF